MDLCVDVSSVLLGLRLGVEVLGHVAALGFTEEPPDLPLQPACCLSVTAVLVGVVCLWWF